MDKHPWADLCHAYGDEEDVPAMLRRLACGDEGEAAAALSDLYAALLHQGTVYAATAEAVPFVARLADAPGVPGAGGSGAGDSCLARGWRGRMGGGEDPQRADAERGGVA